MSSPHVAGVMALFLSEKKDLTVAQLYDQLVNQSTKHFIENVPFGTMNRFINVPV